jgi:hypothetical protein
MQPESFPERAKMVKNKQKGLFFACFGEIFNFRKLRAIFFLFLKMFLKRQL